MKKGTKALFMVLALMLALCIGIGGTLAYLSVKTNSLVNTFTYGDINIDLTESDNLNLKMIPGNTITKDPKVTVKANSEDCWLFIKIEKSANFDDFMTYAIASGWTALTGENGVYYREVEAKAENQEFPVISDDTVIVPDTVTKEELTAISTNYPTLTFTAYAVQKANVADAAAAWNIINPPANS